MSLTFEDLTIPGIVLASQPQRPQIEAVRRKFFGVTGVSEIIGKRGGRHIAFDMIICGASLRSRQAVIQFIGKLDVTIGKHGILNHIYADGVPRNFNECTFEGFEQTAPIMKDEAGTLGTTNGYFVRGILLWYQLRV